MKIAVLSDLHLTQKNFACRTDNIMETQFKKLGYVFNWVIKNDAMLLCAADLFDRTRGYDILVKCLREFNCMKGRLFAIFGQHDMFYRKKIPETNLGILEMQGYVTILNNYGYKLSNDVIVYGYSYGEEIPMEIKEIDKNIKTKILVNHGPIYNNDINGVEGSPARIFLRKHLDYKLILCGDIHQKFIIEDHGRYIVNTGCMLRKSVDIAEHKPCFFVYDTDTNTIEEIEIPHEPLEAVISEKHLTEKLYLTESLNEFIDKIEKSSNDNTAVKLKDNLNNLIKENNIDQDIVNILEIVMSGGKL